MICNLEKTGEFDRRGRPIWCCVNVGPDGKRCRTILAGERVHSGQCEAYDDEAEKTLADLPCPHRGEVTTVPVSLCGSCSRDVEIAPCELFGGLATLAGVKIDRRPTRCCLACEARLAPEESATGPTLPAGGA